MPREVLPRNPWARPNLDSDPASTWRWFPTHLLRGSFRSLGQLLPSRPRTRDRVGGYSAACFDNSASKAGDLAINFSIVCAMLSRHFREAHMKGLLSILVGFAALLVVAG